jgi:hypothetical protein
MNACRPEAAERIRNARDDLRDDPDVVRTTAVVREDGTRDIPTLHVACQRGSVDIPNAVLSVLAEHGLSLDPDQTGRQGDQPVFVAVA